MAPIVAGLRAPLPLHGYGAAMANPLVGVIMGSDSDLDVMRGAIEALTEIVALIDTHEVDPAASLRVALDLGLGAYDSAYLILSRTLGESVITADRRQYEVGIAAGYDTVWLGDLTAD